MIVTPGIVLAEGEEITTDKLNQLGQPTVALDEADVESIVNDVEEALGNGIAGRNYFLNPGLDRWTRGTGPVSCAEGIRQELVDKWWVRCNSAVSMGSGGTFLPSYSRVSSTQHQQWIYGAKLLGESGVGSCDFGQDVAQHVAAALTPSITVTFDLYNATGGNVTPEVRLDSCNAAESYNSVTNRVSVTAGSPVANNELKTFTVTLDTSAIGSYLRNGCQIYVRIPSPRLSSNTSYVIFYALKVEIGGSATSRYSERDLTPATSGNSSGATAPAWLRNGDFGRWLDDSVTCTEDVPNYAAESWAAIPADGSTMVYSRSTNTPGTESLYSAQLTGDAANTGIVDFVQDIPAHVAANMRRSLVYSVEIYNGTGAAFQPTLRLDTCNTANDFKALTNRASTAASGCANGAWTRVELAVDGGTATHMENGARLTIRLAAGTLDNGAKVVRIAQAQINEGSSAADFSVRPVVDVPAVSVITRNLSVTAPGDHHITISADEAVLVEPGGTGLRIIGLSASVDITTTTVSGLDTGTIPVGGGMYHLWLISNGDQHGAMISTSATGPTMPAGYRFKARVGAVRVVTPTAVAPMYQRGGLVFLEQTQLFNGSVTSAGVYQDISAASWVPEYAASMALEVRVQSSGDHMRCTVAAHTGLVAQQDLVGASVGSPVNAAYVTARAEVPVAATPPKFRFKAEATAPTYKINLVGYRLQ